MTYPLSGQAPAVAADDVADLLARVERLLARIDTEVGRLLESCRRATRWLPAALLRDLDAALDRLRHLTARFVAETAKVTANPGWPPTLLSTAADWTTRVGGPVSALATALTADQLRADNRWHGPAADAYRDTLPAQKAAIEGIKQLTDALDTNLTKAGWGILACWTGLAVALGAYLIELVVEAGAAATVVGAPPAAAAAAASTAKAVGLVAAVVGGFVTYLGLLVDSMSSLRQHLAAHEHYPHGAWPRSTTTDFDDASLTDGDTTDWRLMY